MDPSINQSMDQSNYRYVVDSKQLMKRAQTWELFNKVTNKCCSLLPLPKRYARSVHAPHLHIPLRRLAVDTRHRSSPVWCRRSLFFQKKQKNSRKNLFVKFNLARNGRGTEEFTDLVRFPLWRCQRRLRSAAPPFPRSPRSQPIKQAILKPEVFSHFMNDFFSW